MTMRPHINSITRSTSFALKKISSIGKYLDRQSCEKLVHAFIPSRLTIAIVCLLTSSIRIFANFNKSKTHLPALLLSQKNVITSTQSCLTPLAACHSPHNFKVLLLTYKTLSGMAPAYMSDVIHPYVPARTLRSSSSNLLQMPSARTITYKERAFSIRARRLWNSLPLNIKQARSVNHFKELLKKLSVQTGIWLVTHSFHVFCYLSITFVFIYVFAL